MPGSHVEVFTLRTAECTARLINLGATLTELWTPDRHGRSADVVLGFADVAAYLSQPSFMADSWEHFPAGWTPHIPRRKMPLWACSSDG